MGEADQFIHSNIGHRRGSQGDTESYRGTSEGVVSTVGLHAKHQRNSGHLFRAGNIAGVTFGFVRVCHRAVP